MFLPFEDTELGDPSPQSSEKHTYDTDVCSIWNTHKFEKG